MAYTFRTLTEPARTSADPARLADWLRTVTTGFHRPSPITEEEVAAKRDGLSPERCHGAYDERGRCVGALRTFAQELTVPGGAFVRSEAVTNVAVLPTHRRRGLMSSLMEPALALAKERGEVCATLISAEYPIYGRYGFGPAAWTSSLEVDIADTGLNRQRPVSEDGRIELVEAEEFRARAPEMFERFRRLPDSAGVVDRSARWWLTHTGGLRYPEDGFTDRFHVVYRSPGGTDTAPGTGSGGGPGGGTVQGIATYRTESDWEGTAPRSTVEVLRLHAVTPAAERALWHYLLTLDWAVRLRADSRPPDDILPLLLPNPRAAQITALADYLWLRPLDVPALLTARTYPVSGALVLQVTDGAGLADGRFRLEATPDGSTCTPTTAAADLTLPVGSVARLALGDESASRLLRLGLLDEHRPGAATLADVLLRTPRRPWCPDVF